MLVYLLTTSTNITVSTVLGEKASDVEQSRGSGAKLPGRRPPAHCTGRGAVKEGIMFGELSVVCMDVWEWMCE